MARMISPSQTIGPFSAFSLTPTGNGKSYAWPTLVSNEISGVGSDRIKIMGRVINGAGDPHRLTLLEFWHADSIGKHWQQAENRIRNSRSYVGFGRCETDTDGCFSINTIKPGAVNLREVWQAPHIAVAIHSPNLLMHLSTRIYFDDEPLNEGDPVLRLVPADRRSTLVAKTTDGGYRIDFVTQGDNETVFFEF